MRRRLLWSLPLALATVVLAAAAAEAPNPALLAPELTVEDDAPATASAPAESLECGAAELPAVAGAGLPEPVELACACPHRCWSDASCTTFCGGPGQCVQVNSCCRQCLCFALAPISPKP